MLVGLQRAHRSPLCISPSREREKVELAQEQMFGVVEVTLDEAERWWIAADQSHAS